MASYLHAKDKGKAVWEKNGQSLITQRNCLDLNYESCFIISCLLQFRTPRRNICACANFLSKASNTAKILCPRPTFLCLFVLQILSSLLPVNERIIHSSYLIARRLWWIFTADSNSPFSCLVQVVRYVVQRFIYRITRFRKVKQAS